MVNTQIRTIESEFEKVSTHWLQIHRTLTVVIAVASILLEVLMFFFLQHFGLVTSIPTYTAKYLAIPAGLNLLILIAIFWVKKTYPHRLTLSAYAVSLGLVGICFVLFTVHCIFGSLYLLFTVPLMLSCLYGDYILTSATAVAVFIGRVVGDLVIVWDSDAARVYETTYDKVDFIISLFILFGFYVTCLWLIYYEQEKRRAAVKREIERAQFKESMLLDGLTSLYNRKALDEVIGHLEASDEGLICAMFDLDHFKEINDNLGHLAGDDYLRKFSDVLRKNCSHHMPFRYGGDEFCVLFTGISLEEAASLCKKVYRDSARILPPDALPVTVSSSFGLSVYKKGDSVEDMLNEADANLYKHKKGR